MLFKLVESFLCEKFGYHFGDISHKAETRSQQRDRGTGHFGTGYYYIGTYTPEKFGMYGKKECYEIDLSKYNLFKPISYKDASILHQSLKVLNDTLSIDVINNDYHPILDYVEKICNISDINEAISKLTQYCTEWNIPEWLLQTSIQAIKNKKFGELYNEFQNYVELNDEQKKDWNNAMFEFQIIFNLSKETVKKLMEASISQSDNIDSNSTIFMKSLGYDGIDVSHLISIDQEYGFDNFHYGSVIYDLKPNTYKKIKDID